MKWAVAWIFNDKSFSRDFTSFDDAVEFCNQLMDQGLEPSLHEKI